LSPEDRAKVASLEQKVIHFRDAAEGRFFAKEGAKRRSKAGQKEQAEKDQAQSDAERDKKYLARIAELAALFDTSNNVEYERAVKSAAIEFRATGEGSQR
jgi:hypothetical protein